MTLRAMYESPLNPQTDALINEIQPLNGASDEVTERCGDKKLHSPLLILSITQRHVTVCDTTFFVTRIC